MKAKQLPSGNWRAQVYIGKTAEGKKIIKSFTAPTRKEAEALAASCILGYEEVKGTIGEAVESYISNRSNTLSPSTLRAYRTIQRNDFKQINRLKVEDITSEDIQSFVNSLDKSPKSVKNTYSLLKASILAVKPNKAINVRLPQKKVVERHIPTAEDIKNILELSDEELTIAILLASIGTMRLGEICALEYSDIKGNTIHVHRDKVLNESNEFVVKDMPKNASSDRYITYPDEVIKKIGKGEGFIIKSTPRAVSQRYYKICKKLNIKSTRFHDLRHYAASAMHADGIPDRYIMERGGWASDTILKSVYRNVLDDERKAFEEKINENFSAKFF